MPGAMRGESPLRSAPTPSPPSLPPSLPRFPPVLCACCLNPQPGFDVSFSQTRFRKPLPHNSGTVFHRAPDPPSPCLGQLIPCRPCSGEAPV